jgi:arylformamidase
MSVNEASGPEAGRSAADPAELEARRAQARALNDAVQHDFPHEHASYGAHERQSLDLYLPEVAPAGPVLAFLYGGGFRGGDTASVAYHGRPYLEGGALFACLGYRLAPDTRFPDCAEDVELGLQWLYDHVAEHGGDPDRIYLSGHSAGAMLAAQVTLRPRRQSPADIVKGAVLISGMYDFTGHPEDIVNRSSEDYVPVLTDAIERVPDHTVIVAGDQDFPQCLPAAEAMQEALRSRGGSVERFVEPNADHFQANRSFVAAGGEVFEATRRMMKL